MDFRQIFLSLKKSKLLILLLAVFFIKQLFVIAVFPIFQGPDEPAHYTTVQYYAETEEEKYKYKKIKSPASKGFDFSEELTKTKSLTEADKISFHSSITQSFTSTPNGQFEEEIKNSNWKKSIEKNNPSVVRKLPGYYFIPSLIEKSLSSFDIFVRFFSIRIFSAFLGLLIVLLTYLSAKKIGFDEKISFLFSSLIVFQPMFSQSSAIINYDIMLIFTFALFIYGAVWALRERLNRKNTLLMIIAILLGIITKMPAVAFLAVSFFLGIYFIRKHFKKTELWFFVSCAIIATLAIISLADFLLPGKYLNVIFSDEVSSKFTSIFQSISKYISETKNRWDWSELSYWGNFGWLDTPIPSWILSIVHFVEIAGIAGIIAYFIFPKKIPEFLPKKNFIVFLIGIFVALKFAIHYADWRHFNFSGKIEIGTYGRYFLPVIFSQFSLIVIGLGMLARKYLIWKNIVKVLALSMIVLWFYATLMVIIPRYYL